MLTSVPFQFFVALGVFATYSFFFVCTSPAIKFSKLERGAIGILGLISAGFDVWLLLHLELTADLHLRLWVVSVIAAICLLVVERALKDNKLKPREGAILILAGLCIYPFYLETLLSTTNSLKTALAVG